MCRFKIIFISFFIISWTCHPGAPGFAQKREKISYRQRIPMYRERRDAIQARRERKIPKIPPKGKRLRVIIDTDAKNEIDDIWAIALAILSPERFKIEGFVAGNFDNSRFHSIKVTSSKMLDLNSQMDYCCSRGHC